MNFHELLYYLNFHLILQHELFAYYHPVAPEGSEETKHWGGGGGEPLFVINGLPPPPPNALFAQSLPAPPLSSTILILINTL